MAASSSSAGCVVDRLETLALAKPRITSLEALVNSLSSKHEALASRYSSQAGSGAELHAVL